ncbi:MAG: DNA-processing protein DprA [Gemmatimonadetes bacterium]|nr:DNA-processing protein DprA [Gemmatimonadota bacterium]
MTRSAGGAKGFRVSRTARCYPGSLNDLDSPPAQLYGMGDPDLLARSTNGIVAIVGTREASSYGIRVALALGKAFSQAGAVVVSGMARGIDTAAHQGALAASGETIAVLGTGVDVPYPAANSALHRAVAASGLVLSESEPGRRAFKGCFPRRNRIIAALARLTIVVEAGHKSGALNTASQALELGRLVAAVPGPIDAPRAAGSNTLLRDGAHVIASVDDALALFGVSKAPAARPELGAAEAEVWDALQGGAMSVDAISAVTGVAIRDVLGSVAKLELLGLVAVAASGDVGRISFDQAGPGGYGKSAWGRPKPSVNGWLSGRNIKYTAAIMYILETSRIALWHKRLRIYFNAFSTAESALFQPRESRPSSR